MTRITKFAGCPKCLLVLAVAALAAFATPAAQAVTFEQAALAAGYTYASTGLINVNLKGVDSLAGVNLFTAANAISADNNHIPSVGSGMFYGMSNLQYLILSANHFTSIGSGAFSGLSSLQTLDLYANQIISIESGDFFGLSSLQTLSLWYNQITSIESGDFSGLSNLQTLNLRYNHITGISSGAFSGLSTLQTLYLSTNQIGSIGSGAFTGLSKLQELDLGGNSFRHLNLSGADFVALSTAYLNRDGNVTSVDLSDGSLSDLAFRTLMTEFRRGDISSINLRGTDLSTVANLSSMYSLDHLIWLVMAYAGLPDIDEVDDLVAQLEPYKLDELRLSWGQWLLMDGATHTALAFWDAKPANTLLLVDRPGDASGDGRVGDLDASILAANWLHTGDATWQTGDFNGDGSVDDLDASILVANWQSGVGTAVPEPAGWVLLAGLAVVLLTRRVRRGLPSDG